MNILAIGAHFDDIELGCGGALIDLVQGGATAVMVVVTDSGYADPQGRVVREAAQALAEGEKAAALIGARLVALNFPTFKVPDGESLACELAALAAEHRPDLAFTHWAKDEHRDHRNVGLCTRMACRNVPRVLQYRSNFTEGPEPFGGTVYYDISRVFERKCQAVAEHRSELSRVNGTWIELLRHRHALDGAAVGAAFAERFAPVRYLIDPGPRSDKTRL